MVFQNKKNCNFAAWKGVKRLPYFIEMEDNEIQIAIERILEEVLPQGFLVELKINRSARKSLQIFIDTDAGITIEQCALVSRHISKFLETVEIFDSPYELEVSSPGLDRPLTLPRQYQKNLGRVLQIHKTSGEQFVGELIAVQQDHIQLLCLPPSDKPSKKVEPQRTSIAFSDIQKAIVQVITKKSNRKNK